MEQPINNKAFGKQGEDMAVQYLEEGGLRFSDNEVLKDISNVILRIEAAPATPSHKRYGRA